MYARVWGLTALYPPFIALKPLPKAYGGSIGFNLSPEEHLLVVDQLSEFSLEVASPEHVQRSFQSLSVRLSSYDTFKHLKLTHLRSP